MSPRADWKWQPLGGVGSGLLAAASTLTGPPPWATADSAAAKTAIHSAYLCRLIRFMLSPPGRLPVERAPALTGPGDWGCPGPPWPGVDQLLHYYTTAGKRNGP